MEPSGGHGAGSSSNQGAEARTFAPASVNPWGRKPAQSTKQNLASSQTSASSPAEAKLSPKPPTSFQTNNINSRFGDISSSDEEDNNEERPDISRLEASIFGDYELGKGADGDAGIEKIRDHLISAQSGAARCLICLEKIRATDPIWDCQDSCYAIMHLLCIQSWARQSIAAVGLRNTASDPLPSNAPAVVPKPKADANWHCPKCRHDYPSSHIPSAYRCFCGKEHNPSFNPWLPPHTCGETCGRPLESDCGHTCRLLCHPGPCPPCPQLVTARCFCGAGEDVRRCGRQEWACGGMCGRKLACGKHSCKQPCHPGECPPCPEAGVFPCRCRKAAETRTCAQRDFSCGKKCGRRLACGRHACERLCHGGKCGDCPLSGVRVCPCGKTELGELPCDVPTPTCGATCEKLLACGRHACPERCHVGPCVETCRVMTDKACRCGSLRKQVPCFQELQCERRCQRQRACGRHACKRRCCDGDCPPCPEACGRRLRCGNHKCPAPCHEGPCAPCPVTVPIACACGGTTITVPCGTESQVKPPRCSKPCPIPRRCRHSAEVPLHRCHYGNCPPCNMVCQEDLGCGHACPKRCHGPHPPPGPVYALRHTKKQKKVLEQEKSPEGSPCPPCQEPVSIPCLGAHSHKLVACSAAAPFSCGEPCGTALACGNHTCEKVCHVVMTSASVQNGGGDVADAGGAESASQEHSLDSRPGGKGNGALPHETEEDATTPNGGLAAAANTLDMPPPEPCEQCARKCSKPPTPPCIHACPRGCHPGPCPPCTKLIRRKCHCEAGVALAIECRELAAAERGGTGEWEKLLSCGNKCDRKLPLCAHTCQEVCHAGACPHPEQCRKKTNVRCPCRRQKKDWPCTDVRAAQAKSGNQTLELLSCDKECRKLAEQKKAADAAAAKKVNDEPREEQSPRNAVEERPRGRKRGRRRDEAQEQRNLFSEDNAKLLVRASLWALYLLIAIIVVYVCVKLLARMDQYMKTTPPAKRRRPPQYYYNDL
ncbi:hypothetical protein KFL_004790030 [Klebsormidium nitens]|uniref:NF-X1-type domain-containing protein n=1 Tax=Klebsormidium nitens TaxID=105231 RepID=A0A1Y1IHN3_KLENI|nr:hypothetical protein KFL_004790030 [Klebsormidium nitens]|eukprot:GAQ89009.1 hypothetical protein KFL_004790030 [Klebsormidium nitens]